MIPSTSDVGVIVGRFQVHKLHEAHRSLIRYVYESHPQTVIILGLSQARVSIRNPLDFEARKQMLLAEFPKLTVFYLHDQPSDAEWSRRLNILIADYLNPGQTVCLYGGRDSFLAHYQGDYPTMSLEPEAYASGTELRKSITKSVRGTEDFRAGVIWASANQHPRVFPCVDVAVIDDKNRVLLVRKPNERGWRFPGGFAAPTDGANPATRNRVWEAAAVRELREETGIEPGHMDYVGSFLIDDWRYRRETDKICSTFFVTRYVYGPVVPADDVSEARWFDRADGRIQIVQEHLALWRALDAFLAPQGATS